MERGNEKEHLDHILSSSTPAQLLETHTAASASVAAPPHRDRRSSSRANKPIRLTRSRQKLVEEGRTGEQAITHSLDIPPEAESSVRRKRKLTRFSLPETEDTGEGSASVSKKR